MASDEEGDAGGRQGSRDTTPWAGPRVWAWRPAARPAAVVAQWGAPRGPASGFQDVDLCFAPCELLVLKLPRV